MAVLSDMEFSIKRRVDDLNRGPFLQWIVVSDKWMLSNYSFTASCSFRNTITIPACKTNTATAAIRRTIIPIRRLPYCVDTTPISQLKLALPQTPAMKSGVADRVACGPNIRVKRTMLVGKIADVPRPASAAPTIAVD
jgi:hypothetical protein